MIAGKQVRLMPFEQRHLPVIRQWSNDPVLMRLLDRFRSVSEIEHQNWFSRLHENRSACYFAIETITDGQHIGNVWLWDIDGRNRKAEMRIMIGAAEKQGQGLGTEAIALMCQYGYEWLNLQRIYAYVLSINPRAKRAFERAGFILEGTLRSDRWTGTEYCDTYMLGKLSSE